MIFKSKYNFVILERLHCRDTFRGKLIRMQHCFYVELPFFRHSHPSRIVRVPSENTSDTLFLFEIVIEF